jgi:hypothetical protein
LLENIVGAAKSSSNLNVLEAGQEYVMQVGGQSTEYLKLYWYSLSLEYTAVGENSGKLREAA